MLLVAVVVLLAWVALALPVAVLVGRALAAGDPARLDAPRPAPHVVA
ncbi:hypothetical protein [Nocardioides sp. SYSU DS0663]